MRDAISFRVSSKGVVLTLNPDSKISEVRDAIARQIGEAGDFFAGINLYVNLNGCSYSLAEMSELINVLSKFEKVDNVLFLNEKEKSKARTNDTILINRTIRSGQRIKYPTNIVVVGDINPGAEVIAGGDIVVLGKLRGVVHAGAQGEIDAQVTALILQPTQLRIGSIISRPPDENRNNDPLKPERAYVRDGVIIVEELKI